MEVHRNSEDAREIEPGGPESPGNRTCRGGGPTRRWSTGTNRSPNLRLPYRRGPAQTKATRPRRSTLVDRIAQVPFEPKGGESMLKAKNELLGPNEDLSSEKSQCWGQGGQPRPQSSTQGARGPIGSPTMPETSSETEDHQAQLPIDGSTINA